MQSRGGNLAEENDFARAVSEAEILVPTPFFDFGWGEGGVEGVTVVDLIYLVFTQPGVSFRRCFLSPLSCSLFYVWSSIERY